MNHTDPTYLRSIHDGLLFGTIHKDNAYNLPIGLIGIYEEALPPASNVNERKKFLEFFLVWALLKKEVSAAFVVPLLEGWTEKHVLDYISEYSKWFNSPVSGKYVLYHERLRSFILQKISHAQFAAGNEAIINYGQMTLGSRSYDEWELYALEHMSTLLLIQVMESKDATALKALAYNKEHWNRQVEISKEFEWSKRMLNDMMLWASKYDEDEVIECALNKVDLYYAEQNDAPRIVELVAQNDMDTALQRIKAFGGNDQEGLQRKFILYMLCLMELTLLDSKDKPFRKDAIEKLLKQLDDNLPVDHSVLNWNDFFPSYLVFQMACEWAVYNLDYGIVFRRTNYWEHDWIKEKGPYNELEFQTLLEFARGLGSDSIKNRALESISCELAKQGKFEAALEWIQDISTESGEGRISVHCVLLTVATEMVLNGRLNEAVEVVQDITQEVSPLFLLSIELAKQGRVYEALATLQSIINEDEKITALSKISKELKKQIRIPEVAEALVQFDDPLTQAILLPFLPGVLAREGKFNDALEMVKGLIYEGEKSTALTLISIEMSAQGRISEAIEIASAITDEEDQDLVFSVISWELVKMGQVSFAKEIAYKIIDESKKIIALSAVVLELTRQEKVSEAIEIATVVTDEYDQGSKVSTYRIEKGLILMRRSIPIELTKLDKLEQAFQLVAGMEDFLERRNIVERIAIQLAEQGKLHQALETLRGIDLMMSRFRALSGILRQLVVGGKSDMVSPFVFKFLEIKKGVSIAFRTKILSSLALELARRGKVNEVFMLVNNLPDEYEKVRALSSIQGEIVRQKDFLENFEFIETALNVARGIEVEHSRIWASLLISEELASQGQLDSAFKVLNELLADSRSITENGRSLVLANVAALLIRQNKVQEALDTVNNLKNEDGEDTLFISREFARQGEFSIALDYARSISSLNFQAQALSQISVEFARQGKPVEALELAKNIKEGGVDFWKLSALLLIAVEFAKQGNWVLAEQTGCEISRTNRRQTCWQSMAANILQDSTLDLAIQLAHNLKDQEAVFFYLKGIARNLSPANADAIALISVLPEFSTDPESIEFLLQLYAFNYLFFPGKSEYIKINRLNRTLNIQWAIDLKNSINVN